MTRLLAFLTGSNAAAQPPMNDIEALLRRHADGQPGGALVVMADMNGEPRLIAVGRHSADDARPPAMDTVFEIGSVTKVFTGLLLAQAVVEGKASLDDPISRHLPADLELSPEVAAITLGQLATHTSGLPPLPMDFTPATMKDPYADYTTASLYTSLRNLSIAGRGPHAADYSNLGMGLLGHLLERLHGKDYADLVAEKIARPLGLADTVVTPDAGQVARLAPPHSGKTRVAGWTFQAMAGAGALRSTAADMVKFARGLAAEDNPLRAAWELARQPRADFPAYGGRTKMGLGFLVDEREDGIYYGHDGGTGGYRSHWEFSPSAGRIMVILVNNDHPEGFALAVQIHGLGKPRAAANKAVRTEAVLASGALADYPGVYAIDKQASFTVVVDDAGVLRVRLTGQPFLPAFFMGDDRFFLKVVEAEYQFGRDASGKVDSITQHQNGRNIPAKRTARDVPRVLFRKDTELAAFAGDYELAPGLLFEVKARGGQLYVKLTDQDAYPVFCEREDHFVYDVVEASLTFERDAAGRVAALVLHQNGMDQRAARK